MAKFSIPYLKMRNGRPRWEPGPRLRKAGWTGRNLRHEDGTWMDVGEAMLAARAINDEVAAWRAGGKRRRRKPEPQRHAHSCQALFDHWYASSDFTKNGRKTQRDYKSKAKPFLELFGEHHVRAVTKPQLIAFWERCRKERGHHMANGMRAVYSAAFTYAELIGWRDAETNPALKMKRPRAPARLVIWLPEELTTLVETADRMGLFSAGDATIIGLHSGQRLSDCLMMPPRIFDETHVRLTQLKTTAMIDAPMTPVLLNRIHAMRQRRRVQSMSSIATAIVRDDTGTPHTDRTFNTTFRTVRTEAAKLVPSLATKNFQDLRDTAVTRLALADCTMPQIAAITGHSLPSITQIMKHYLALQPEMADAAIDKLNRWMVANNIAI